NDRVAVGRDTHFLALLQQRADHLRTAVRLASTRRALDGQHTLIELTDNAHGEFCRRFSIADCERTARQPRSVSGKQRTRRAILTLPFGDTNGNAHQCLSDWLATCPVEFEERRR